MEQKHMVVTGWHGRIEGNIGHIHMVQVQRRKVREARKERTFLFYSFFIESHQFVILI